MVYPTLLPLMRTPRLPVVDWTGAPRRFKWTRPFRRKTKSGFCACAISFQLASTTCFIPSCFDAPGQCRPLLNLRRLIFDLTPFWLLSITLTHYLFHFFLPQYIFFSDQPRGLVVRVSWLLIMRSRFRFPALPWEFSLKGKIPAVTVVWVD